jgi:hypothetical protein
VRDVGAIINIITLKLRIYEETIINPYALLYFEHYLSPSAELAGCLEKRGYIGYR